MLVRLYRHISRSGKQGAAPGVSRKYTTFTSHTHVLHADDPIAIDDRREKTMIDIIVRFFGFNEYTKLFREPGNLLCVAGEK
jgi:hypothetical protein